jgi:hypothetical protein
MVSLPGSAPIKVNLPRINLEMLTVHKLKTGTKAK